PDLLVSGKSLGGGLPLAAVTGRAEIMDAPAPGGLGGTFGGNPVSCAAALAVLDEVDTDSFREHSAALGRTLRAGFDALAERVPSVGDVRGLGPMLALELVHEDGSPAPELASATTAKALDRGLVLLSCGIYGNVIRTLVPLVATDEEIEQGLAIMEESLVHAGAGAA
ncbi:MAG: aminotransferase class III-fold pyridoxal phosphate-dependent enzyme, partial [Gaiellaceae bacterium]